MTTQLPGDGADPVRQVQHLRILSVMRARPGMTYVEAARALETPGFYESVFGTPGQHRVWPARIQT